MEAPRSQGGETDSESARQIEALERRTAHLEAVLEGLQDAVHRESVRVDDRLGRLEAKTDPGEIARALSQNARERGI